MLEFMRNAASTWAAKLFFGLLVASFALWGINGIFLQSNTRNIAVVGDSNVTDNDFSRAFSRAMRQIELRSNAPVDQQEAVAQGLHFQVAGDLVSRAIFTEVARDLGLVVTDEQLRAELRQMPGFIDDFGKFDRLRFDQTLQMLRYTEQEFLDSMRNDILREMILGTVSSATVAPKAMAALLFQHRAEQRQARFITIPAVTPADIATPDEATLRAYYEATPGPFTAPEYREVAALHIAPENLADDVAIEEADIKTVYEARKGTLGTAEKRDVVIAVFADQAAIDTALSRIATGEMLAAVAADMLGRPQADLIEKGLEFDIVADAPAGAAFGLALNAVSDPIDTAFGPTLVSPVAIVPADIPAYKDVRDQLAAELQKEHAADLMFDLINKIEDERAGGATMEQAAEKAGLSIGDHLVVDAQGFDRAGAPVALFTTDAALLEDLNNLLPGEESPLLETNNNGYVIIRIDNVIDAALKPYDDVKDEVLTTWKAREAATKTQTQALTLGNKVRAAGSLDKIAGELGVTVETALSVNQFQRHETLSPALVQALFSAQDVGEIVEAGAPDGSYLIAELTGVRKFSASDAPVQFDAVRGQLNQAFAGNMVRYYQTAVQDELGVTLNEPLINRIVGAGDEGAIQ